MNITFSRFIYFDTNIYSILAKRTELWRSLFDYLTTNDLCIGLTDANMTELSEATRKHERIADLLLFMPSALIKSFDSFFDEEVSLYPNPRITSIMACSLNQLLGEKDGKKQIIDQFRSKNLRKSRAMQKHYAKGMEIVLQTRKANFPPKRKGKKPGTLVYSWQQAQEFERGIVLQWISKTHTNFVSKAGNIDISVFKSIRLFALVIYSKYYVDRQKPEVPNDFGDLFPLLEIPYFAKVVVERNLCEHLGKVSKQSDVLDAVEDITNVSFLGNLSV